MDVDNWKLKERESSDWLAMGMVIMASAFMPRSTCVQFPLGVHRSSISPIRPLSDAISSSSSSLKLGRVVRTTAVTRASTTEGGVGAPTELTEEESKFVPLNEDDPQFGPPALLLLGFEVAEANKIKEMLKEMDGEFLQIIFCTEEMITRSLWEAFHTKQPDLKRVKVAKQVPRVCFLSGLTGEEMMMFIDSFPETGLEEAVFAALVPNSADKLVEEVIEEIMGDHEMLVSSLLSL